MTKKMNNRPIFNGLINRFPDGSSLWLTKEDTAKLLKRADKSGRFIKEISCMPAIDSSNRKAKHFGKELYQPDLYERWYYAAFNRLCKKSDELIFCVRFANIHDYFKENIFSDCKDHYFYNLK